jgi:hypothetical protein
MQTDQPDMFSPWRYGMKIITVAAVLLVLGLFLNPDANAKAQNQRGSKAVRKAPARSIDHSRSSMNEWEREYARQRIIEQENASRPRSFPRNY